MGTVATARLVLAAVLVVPGLAAVAPPAAAAEVGPTPVGTSHEEGRVYISEPETVWVDFIGPVGTSSEIEITGAGPGCEDTTVGPAPDDETGLVTRMECTTFEEGTWGEGGVTVTAKPQLLERMLEETSFSFFLDPEPVETLVVDPLVLSASSEALTVSGTTTASVLTVDFGPLSQAPAIDEGTYEATFTGAQIGGVADGDVPVTVTYEDPDGETFSRSTTVTKDTPAPSIVDSSPEDGGSSRSDGFAYVVQADEALGDGSTVRVYDQDDTELAVDLARDGSTLMATPASTLPEGDYSADVVLVDQAGNRAEYPDRAFSIDDTAPAAPVFDEPLTPVNAESAGAHTISGTAEPGTTIDLTVTDGSGDVVTPAVPEVQPRQADTATDGSWQVEVDASGLEDGDLTVTATATDPADNLGESAEATVVKDTVAPSMAGVDADDASGDATTQVRASVTDGAVPPLPEAADVVITASDTNEDTADVALETSVGSSGLLAQDLDLTGLSDGTITIAVIATDSVGNASEPARTTLQLDTEAPNPPTVEVSPATINTGSGPTLTVTGDAADARSVTVSVGGTDYPGSVLAGQYTVSIPTSDLPEGVLTVEVRGADDAGNEGAPGTATVTKDTVRPDAPTFDLPDFVTESPLTVTGTSEPGAIVEVWLSPVPTEASDAETTADEDGTWTVDLDVSELPDGPLTVTAQATDVAGNDGTPASEQTTKDFTAPGEPTGVAFDPGFYGPESTDLTVSGTYTVTDPVTVTVTLSDDDDSTPDLVLADQPVEPSVPGDPTIARFAATFTAEDVQSLTDGTLTATAVLVDEAGNQGTEVTATTVKDVVALALESTKPADNASTNDLTAVSATLNEPIAGVGGSNDEPSRLAVANKNGVLIAGEEDVDGATISFTPSTPFTEAGSPYTAQVLAGDADATGETVVATWTFSMDTTAPAAPELDALSPATLANQEAFPVSGDAEAGTTVRVEIGAASGDAVAAEDGSFDLTLDVSGEDDGALTASAVATDAAGNDSPATEAGTTKDTARPALVSASPAQGSTVQPPATVTLAFDESLAAGEVSVDGVPGTTEVDGATVTFTPTDAFPDGLHTATAGVEDAVGNDASAEVTFTVDGTPPGDPVLADGGPVNLGNQDAYTVSGTAERLSAVEVTAGSRTASVAADETGAFAAVLDLSGEDDGVVTVTATVTDAAGNTSGTSEATATKDTVRPSLQATTPDDDALVTPPARVTFSFDEALGSAEITVDGVAGATSTDAATAVFTPGATFPDGTHTATATVTDAAGNARSAETTFTVDGTPPDAPSLDDLAPVNTARAASYDVSGTAEPGSTVTLLIGSVGETVTASGGVAFAATFDLSGEPDGTLAVTATAADTLGNLSEPTTTEVVKDTVDPAFEASLPTDGSLQQSADGVRLVFGEALGTAEITVAGVDGTTTVDGDTAVFAADAPLPDGEHVVTAAVTDRAGNPGEASIGFTVDGTAPAAPSLEDPAPINLASVDAYPVTGSAEPSSTVEVTAGDLVDTVVADGTGAFSATFDLGDEADGAVEVTARATDAASNVSATGAVIARKDTVRPSLVSSSPTDGAVVVPPSEVRLVLSEPLDAAEVTVPGVPGATDLDGTTVVFTPDGELPDGTHTATAEVADGAGNPATVAITLTTDGTAPAAPVLATPGPVNEANAAAYTVSGTAERLASVEVVVSGVTATVAADETGDFSVVVDLSDLADGPVVITATATDAAGNTGEPAEAATAKDTVLPSLVGTSPADGATTNPPTTITFVFDEALGDAEVSLPGSPGDTTIDGDSVVFTPEGTVPDGEQTATAEVTDAAGNPRTATATFTVDGTAPDAPTLDPLGPVSIATVDAYDVSGSAEPGSSVAVLVGTTAETLVADDEGAFATTLDLGDEPDGSLTVTARATDGVGNTGAASEEIVAKDTVAPLARDLVATQASTASPTTTVTGTRSEASAVTVTVTDGTTEASAEVPSGEGAFEADVDVASMEPGTLDVLVEVEDAVGNTSASATVTEVRITTTAVLDALPRRVTFGETVVVSGAIEVPEGAPRPSEQVDLVEVRDGTDLVVAPVPLEDGRFAVELTPTGTATYAIRYAGGSLHTASRSNEETVRVAWALRAKAPSTSQQRVRVSGRVDPARAGTRVVVHELVKGEGARSLGRTTTRRNGRFVIRVAVPEGRSRLRVKVPGAQDLAVARVKLTTRRR